MVTRRTMELPLRKVKSEFTWKIFHSIVEVFQYLCGVCIQWKVVQWFFDDAVYRFSCNFYFHLVGKNFPKNTVSAAIKIQR